MQRNERRSHTALLSQLSDTLGEQLGETQPSYLAFDPSDRRARYLAALHAWFVAVSLEQPLLVAVDNIQAADPNSAALLASLGHVASQHAILLLLTQRAGDGVVAPEPLRAMRKHANQLKLGALTQKDCEKLVRSLFGDVPNNHRMGYLLYERSGGNPRHCLDLGELLVRRRIAKYAGGTWVLPLEVAPDELPSRVEDWMAGRLAEVTGAARDLVETLSVDGSPVSIERCEALSPGRDPAEVYEALGELVIEQILVVDGDRYRFRQDEPPVGLETELRSSASRLRENEAQSADEAFDVETAMAEFAELTSPSRDYSIVMLTMRRH
jgi:predicted ATPase